MLNKWLPLFSAVFAIIALPSISLAEVLLQERFSLNNAALVGQNGWVRTGTTTALPLTVSSGSVNMVQGTAEDASKPFSASVTSGSVFFALDFKFTAKNATGDYAIHLSDGGTSNFSPRVYAKSSNTGFALGLSPNSTTPTYGADLAFNTSYRMVVEYDIVVGALNDTMSLYLVPLYGSGVSTIQADYTAYQSIGYLGTTAELSTFSNFNLRQGTNSGSLTVDNISVGTSFADAVPEPSAACLLGIGSIGMLHRRRRTRVISA